MSPDWKVKHLGIIQAQVFVQSLKSLLGKRQPRQHLGCFECTVVLVQVVHCIPQCSHGSFGFLFCRDMKGNWKMPSIFICNLKTKNEYVQPGKLLHSICLADHGWFRHGPVTLVLWVHYTLIGISPQASGRVHHPKEQCRFKVSTLNDLSPLRKPPQSHTCSNLPTMPLCRFTGTAENHGTSARLHDCFPPVHHPRYVPQ